MSTNILVEIVGWIGSALVVAAYFLNMRGLLPSDAAVYKWLNIIGSLGLIVLTLYHRAIPSAVVNIIWTVVGISALFNPRKRKERQQTDA